MGVERANGASVVLKVVFGGVFLGLRKCTMCESVVSKWLGVRLPMVEDSCRWLRMVADG